MHPSPRQTVFWIAIGFGLLTGTVTLFAKETTAVSGNQLIATLQQILIIPCLPGLVGAAIIGSLGVGALINLAFYSLLGRLVSLFVKSKHRSIAI
jgi:hypothetical protein